MSTIEVGTVGTIREDIAHSVKIFHEYYNSSEKEIKYITFSYVPYNSVNDIVACTASGKSEVSGKLTGPIPPKYKSYVSWENMWFNPTITSAIITKIHIQYMDNTEEIIDGKDLLSMEDESSAYYHDIGRTENIRQELQKNWSTGGKHNFSLEMFENFKNDEEALLKIFDNVKIYYSTGYAIGDYIEKEYSSNEKLMKKAVSLWKSSVSDQQKYYNTAFAKEHPDFPKIYATKIKKYEPEYVIPKKAGCITIGK